MADASWMPLWLGEFIEGNQDNLAERDCIVLDVIASHLRDDDEVGR